MRPAIALCSIVTMLVSCKPFQMFVPDEFARHATEMKVKGLNGFQKRISFGAYKSSKIKTKWGIITQRADRPSEITPEDRIFSKSGVDEHHYVENRKASYQYSLSDSNATVKVFCQEKKSSDQTLIKTHSRWLGDFRTSANYQYSLSAVILPQSRRDSLPWQVVLFRNYDRKSDTASRLLSQPYVEEAGYAANKTDTITIRPFYVKHYADKAGKQHDYPFKIPAGYELRMQDGVVAIVDTIFERIWIYNDLEPRSKLILAAIGSSILLRKVNAFE